jgi:hypothetical protein
MICLMILMYVPVVSTYFGFGALAIEDWLFPIMAGVIFLLIREGVKTFRDIRIQE